MTNNGHLMTDELAAYLEGTLPSDRAGAVEAHLARCDHCRADFVAARRVLTPRPSVWPTRLLGSALVAALLLAVPALWSRISQRSAPDLERAAPPRASVSLMIVAPAEGARIPAGGVRLTWRSAGVETQYRITVTDSAGGRIWSAESADTTAALDPALTARPGPYYWMVDALLPDGRIRSSGTYRFSTAP